LQLGMLGEVGVGEHAHGVAEVEFAEVVLAVCGVEIVNPKGAVVLSDEVGLQVVFQRLLLSKGEADTMADDLIGQKEIALIHPVGRGEKRETPER